MNKINGFIENKSIEAEEILNNVGNIIEMHGSVYKIRKMSNFAFVILRTKRKFVQCIYSEDFSKFPLSELKEEACIRLTANVIKEERSKTGYELQLIHVQILSEPKEELPIVIHNKTVDTSLENLLNYRAITLRNEKERAIFKIQEGICNGFRTFLLGESFTEVHTPKIVYAGAEGGANIFKLNYFDREAFLAQSPQVYKQMMVGVYERVFEIAPVFRAEKHDTSRHLNEYTSVDFEMGYINSFEDIMQMETKMLQTTMRYLRENYSYELQILNIDLPVIDFIPTIQFIEAKEMVAKAYHREIKDFNDFEPEEEKLLCELMKEQMNSEFVFVTHYPREKRPFYVMEESDTSKKTLSFDLLFRGLEITTGGQRIHNYGEQIAKMKRLGMDVTLFDSYLMMHKYGMPPHGGLGLGLERFTSKLLNQNNVRYSTLFPRDINRLIP